MDYRKTESEAAKAALRDAAKALFAKLEAKPVGLNSTQHALLEAMVVKEFCRSFEDEADSIPYFKKLAAWLHIVSNQSAMAQHLAKHGLVIAPSDAKAHGIESEEEADLFA